MPKPNDKPKLDRVIGNTYDEALASIKLSSYYQEQHGEEGEGCELSFRAAFSKLTLRKSTLHQDSVSDRRKQKHHLLGFPGEILNLIYGFALAFDHTFVCREIDTSKRPVRPGNDEGKSFRLYLSVTGDTEANQMKYVCRQLRSDTKKLELKYNTIAFVQEEADSWSATAPLEKCSQFLTSCGSIWLQCISRVVILHHSTDQVEYRNRSSDRVLVRLSTSDAEYNNILTQMEETSVYKDACSIADFCARHPSARVDYYDPRFSMTRIRDTMFFWYGIFQKIARGIEVPTSLVSADFQRGLQNINIRPGSCVGVALKKFADLPNFRIFPSDTLDVDLLKTGCLLKAPTSIILPHVHGGVETLAREVQKWYEEGI